MCEYRFYFIDSKGFVDGPARVFELIDDGSAFKQAKSILDKKDIEIWEGSRLVAYIVPDKVEKPKARVDTDKDQHA